MLRDELVRIILCCNAKRRIIKAGKENDEKEELLLSNETWKTWIRFCKS